jgi:L-threonylcarbamoyladenylate synthase
MASTIIDLTGDVPRLLRAGVIPIDKIREVTGVIEDPPEPELETEPPADEAAVEAEAQAETAGNETGEAGAAAAGEPAAKEQ